MYNASPKNVSHSPTNWFLKGHEEGSSSDTWMSTYDHLNSIYESKASDLVNNYLSICYVNDKNNTLFVGLTDISKEVRNAFLQLINPPEGLTIKFTKSAASRADLEAWENILNSKIALLNSNNIKVVSSVKTVNGTISIGLENRSQIKINSLLKTLDRKVPPGILEIFDSTVPTLCDRKQYDKWLPAEGGITAYNAIIINGNQHPLGTIGYVVSWSGGAGILTVAHLVNYTCPTLVQGYPFNYTLGTCIASTETNAYYSDAALVQFATGVNGNPHIFDNSSFSGGVLKRVAGRLHYSQLLQGQSVCTTGSATGYQTGTITGLGEVTHEMYGVLVSQITVSQNVAKGDSGCPLYTPSNYAVGVIWGHKDYTNPGVASSIDGIEKDLIDILGTQINLCFTGPWIDSFDDDQTDTASWDPVLSGSGYTIEGAQQLKLLPDKNSQVGLVSKSPMPISAGTYFQVEITDFVSPLKEMCIMISSDKVPYGNSPTSGSNWFRCYRSTAQGGKWIVEKRLNGGNIQTVSTQKISSLVGGSLKIMVSGITIYFYDLQNGKQSSTGYPLVGDKYLYIYGSSGNSGGGFGYFDNWYYSGNSVSWLNGWSLRKPIYIGGSTAGALTDYDVPVKVYYGTGTDGAEALKMSIATKIYASNQCKSDFGDVRFTDADGTTLLSYFKENSTAGSWALFWVKIPLIPYGFPIPTNAKFYIYIGNGGASTASNGANTFPMFDDFESAQDIPGSPPQGWDVITKGANDQFVVANNQVKEGGKSLYTYETGGDGVNIAVKRTGTLVYRSVLTAWMRADDSGSRFSLETYQSAGATSPSYLLCRKDQADWRYREYTGTYYTVPNWGTVSSNTWYRLESFISQVDNKVTYCNDRSSNSGWVNYNSAPPNVDSVRIDSNYNYGGGAWWDQIFLRPYANPEPTMSYVGYWETS